VVVPRRGASDRVQGNKSRAAADFLKTPDKAGGAGAAAFVFNLPDRNSLTAFPSKRESVAPAEAKAARLQGLLILELGARLVHHGDTEDIEVARRFEISNLKF
jgi:hypothetical protein